MTPVVHKSIAAARGFYILRRRGFTHAVAAKRVQAVDCDNYWGIVRGVRLGLSTGDKSRHTT